MATTAVTKFEEAALPAHLRAPAESVTNAIAALAGGNFPYLSIKGKAFTVVRNKEETIIMRPDDDETPANAIEVVIVNSATNFAKVYYAGGYTEGSKDKPTCYSNDGQAPAPDSAEKQAKKCASCEHNVWGSGVDNKGNATGKGKRCSDSLRIAISPPDTLNDPMLLRVPPASLKAVTEYAAMLARKGAPLEGVVTKIRFDPAEATPKLQFTPVRFLDEKGYTEAIEIAKSTIVQQIIGTAPAPQLTDKSQAEPTKDEPEDTPPAKATKPTKAVEKPAEEAPPAKPKKAATTAKVSDLAAKLKASLESDDTDD